MYSSLCQISGLFKDAQRLIWQAALRAEGEIEVLGVLADLGEVLMTSGNKRDAELILRSALRNENLPASVRILWAVLDVLFIRVDNMMTYLRASVPFCCVLVLQLFPPALGISETRP